MTSYKVYKIFTEIDDQVYIGVTKTTLSQRFSSHKSSYKSFINGGKCQFMTSFELFAKHSVHNCKIELLEDDIPKDCKFIRERYWCNEYGDRAVNKVKNMGIIGELGKKEYYKMTCRKWYENNPDKVEIMKEKSKKWQRENKEHVNELSRERRKKMTPEELEEDRRRQRESNKKCYNKKKATDNEELVRKRRERLEKMTPEEKEEFYRRRRECAKKCYYKKKAEKEANLGV